MNIWLVTVGEPLPTDAGTPRLLRAGIIAHLLRDRGHEVHWWTSSFDHQSKQQRCNGYERVEQPSGIVLHLLPGRSYQTTVSLARIGNHRDNARAFAALSREQAAPPDIIVCSYPTLELCDEAVSYGQQAGVPVVVDVRDLWPDVFCELLPRYARPMLRLALAGMYRQSRRVMQRATVVIGITDDFVAWARRRGSRKPSDHDRAYPMAYVEKPPSAAALERAEFAWRGLGVGKGDLNFVFFGTIGRQFDLSTVIAAARETRDPRVRFILCGTGDRLDEYQAEAADCSNVVFPGWVDAPMIRSLMLMAQAGLAPYRHSENFNSNIPNKIVEYFAGGLPVITTLTGVCRGLLDEHDCGISYRHGDRQSLIEAVKAVATDPIRQQALAANALSLYRQRFDAAQVYGAMIDDFSRIVRQHRDGGVGARVPES